MNQSFYQSHEYQKDLLDAPLILFLISRSAASKDIEIAKFLGVWNFS
jgi:hypothetical protein